MVLVKVEALRGAMADIAAMWSGVIYTLRTYFILNIIQKNKECNKCQGYFIAS